MNHIWTQISYTVCPRKQQNPETMECCEQVLGCMTIMTIIIYIVEIPPVHASLSSIVFKIECQNQFVPLSGGGTVWAMWASGPPTFLTVWAWPTYFWHYFLLFLFCLSPLIIDFFQDWPTHFQNRSAAPGATLR